MTRSCLQQARALLLALTVLPAANAAQPADAPAGAAAGSPITVERRGCQGLHVVAKQARLGEVLAELSKQAKFELRDQAGDTRAVDLDMTARPEDLVARLLAGGNLVTDDEPDPKCAGKVRLTKVWVLPKGQDAPAESPAAAPHELTPMEVYRKAHGLPLDDKDTKPSHRDPAESR